MLIKNSPCNAYVVLLLLVAMSNLHFVIHFIFRFVLCTLILLCTLHDSLDENKKRREILGLRFHGYGWSKLKILKTSVLALFWDKTRANWSIVSKWRPCLLLSNRWERLRHTFWGYTYEPKECWSKSPSGSARQKKTNICFDVSTAAHSDVSEHRLCSN